MLEHKCSGR